MNLHSNILWSRENTSLRATLLGLALAGIASFGIFSCAKSTGSGDETGAACGKVKCGTTCSATAPCPGGTYCNSSSVCTADCTTDADCAGGHCQTSNGQCSVFTTIGTGGSGGTTPTDGGATGTLLPGNGGIKQVDPQVIEDIQANACSGWTTELETLPAVLEFVIDTSYSMAEKKVQGTTWTLQGQGQTKWQITHDALVPALDGLGAGIAAGMVFFPNHALVNQTFATPQPVATCFNSSNAVPVDTLGTTGSAQRTALQTALNAIQPNGNTPTFEAYAYGVAQMQQVSGFDGQKYMVLMTDGVPTFGEGCVGNGQETANNIIPTDPIIKLVSDAAAVGIKTFVIGSPGSQDGINGADARPWLSAAARAGQTAAANCSDSGPAFCHMDMTQSADFGAALREGLGVISSQLGNCQYAMPTPPPGEQVDVNQLSVFVQNSTGTYYVQSSTQTDCTEGWQLVDGTIQLCPASCDRAQSDASASVQILAGCAQAVQETINVIQ